MSGSAVFATVRLRLATAATRISVVSTRPWRAGALEGALASDNLDLHEARGARAPGGKARGDAHALAGLTPAELDHAPRGVGDQRLGRLVAAHRGGLHAPHQAAA